MRLCSASHRSAHALHDVTVREREGVDHDVVQLRDFVAARHQVHLAPTLLFQELKVLFPCVIIVLFFKITNIVIIHIEILIVSRHMNSLLCAIFPVSLLKKIAFLDRQNDLNFLPTRRHAARVTSSFSGIRVFFHVLLFECVCFVVKS